MNARSEDDWNAMIDAWRQTPVGTTLADPHGLRHRVMAESRRMTINLLIEYAVGLALVGFAAWRLATGPAHAAGGQLGHQFRNRGNGHDGIVGGGAFVPRWRQALSAAAASRPACARRSGRSGRSRG